LDQFFDFMGSNIQFREDINKPNICTICGGYQDLVSNNVTDFCYSIINSFEVLNHVCVLMSNVYNIPENNKEIDILKERLPVCQFEFFNFKLIAKPNHSLTYFYCEIKRLQNDIAMHNSLPIICDNYCYSNIILCELLDTNELTQIQKTQIQKSTKTCQYNSCRTHNILKSFINNEIDIPHIHLIMDDNKREINTERRFIAKRIKLLSKMNNVFIKYFPSYKDHMQWSFRQY